MDTKKFKINSENENGGKKKITKSSILSKAGFTIFGGVAGAAFTSAAYGMPSNTEDEPSSEDMEQHAHSPQPGPVEPDPVEPDPVVPDPVEPDPEDPEYVDPDEVAEILTQDIDADDLDDAILFTPDGYDEAYMPDGTRQFVLVGHDPDGNGIILADIDGDGLFGDFFDSNGNLIVQIDEGLSVSDILEMADATGGYIAGLNEPWEDEDTNEMPSDDQEVADIEEEVNEDDLFAQLTEEDDDESAELDRFFSEGSGGEDEESEIVEEEYVEEEFVEDDDSEDEADDDVIDEGI